MIRMSKEILKNSALVIVGHGSTINPSSSIPYFLHAEKIREQEIFQEVHCCFWKEEPAISDIFYQIESKIIYIVPDFISSGYFTQEVIPRELKLSPGKNQIGEKIFYYTEPVGTHSMMTNLLIRKANQISKEIPKEETTLYLFGHGTSLNTNSKQAIQNQILLIRERENYANVLDAYIDEAPFISDWHQRVKSSYVIGLPFFISDGLHTYEDIPRLIGIKEKEKIFEKSPFLLSGKQFFYSRSIGNESEIAEIIVERALEISKI